MIEIKGRQGAVWTIHFNQYPDGIPIAKTTGGLTPASMLLRWETLSEFTLGLMWIHAMRERRMLPEDFRLIIPFFPGARQDRLNTSGDFLFSAKYFAGLVNALKLDSVVVVDPHSEVTPALLDRCHVVTAATCFAHNSIGGYDAVISPDAGAEKRAGLVAKMLGVPLIHAWKSRDIKTGKITGFGLEASPLDGSGKVLVVDDICDGGGTFIGLADQIAAHGLSADLWVTHGLFTNGTAELATRYNSILTTDSILPLKEHQSLHINNICNTLL